MNCRIDPALLKLRGPGETNREFVERAMACLRDEHAILLKLVLAMIDNGISVPDITQDERAILEKLVAEALASAHRRF